MILGDEERMQVAEIVIRVCRSQAPRFRSYAEAAIGPMYEKVVGNLEKLHLNDPPNH